MSTKPEYLAGNGLRIVEMVVPHKDTRILQKDRSEAKERGILAVFAELE